MSADSHEGHIDRLSHTQPRVFPVDSYGEPVDRLSYTQHSVFTVNSLGGLSTNYITSLCISKYQLLIAVLCSSFLLLLSLIWVEKTL